MRRDWRAVILAAGMACLVGCSTGGTGTSGKSGGGTPGELSAAGNINIGLAQSYLASNDLELALNRANRALASDPNNGNVHAMLGLIYDRVGDTQHATSSFQRALQLSPNSGAVLNAYGSWLCSHGDMAGAEDFFKRALNDPFYTSYAQVHYNAGQCAAKAGNLVRAESELRDALNSQGADPGTVMMALAEVELAQGKLMEARAFVQRREALGARPDVLELAARIEDAAGDRAAAARYRERARAASGQRTPAQEGAERQ
jgi:type IV pilus assembly protein PilF